MAANIWNSLSGLWSTATDWSAQTVPNGEAVQIGAASGSPDVVTIAGGTLGLVSGTLVNYGTISIATTNYPSGLGIIGTTVLSGGGQITLSGASETSYNHIAGTQGSATLENVDNTISGAEIIGYNGGSTRLDILNNSGGMIAGTGKTVALLINGNSGNGLQSMTVTNNGLMEANSSTGYSQALQIDSVVLNQSGGGTLLAANGEVRLSNTTVIGGTLETSGSGLIETLLGSNATATLDGSGALPITITQGSTVDAAIGEIILDGSIVNHGTIAINPPSYSTAIAVGTAAAPTATLTGGGSVRLANSISFIEANIAGATLDNVDNTISGAGTIGVNGGSALLWTLKNSPAASSMPPAPPLPLSSTETLATASRI